MAEEPQEIDRVAVRLAWVGVEEMPVVFANQVLAQVDDAGEAIIMFGQAAPPILLGSADEQRQQAALVPFVQVRPVARLTLSRARIEQLITVLQQTLENQAIVVSKLGEEGSA